MQIPRPIELAAIGIALLVGLAFAASQVIPAPVDSGDWAAWAQAFGSVAAICVTAWLAFLPLQAENRRRRQAKVDFLIMVTDAVELALLEIEPLVVAMADDGGAQIHPAISALNHSGVEKALEELMDIPINLWPTTALFTRTHRFLAGCQRLRTAAHYWAAYWGHAPNRVDPRQMVVDLRAREAEFRQCLAGLKLDG